MVGVQNEFSGWSFAKWHNSYFKRLNLVKTILKCVKHKSFFFRVWIYISGTGFIFILSMAPIVSELAFTTHEFIDSVTIKGCLLANY